MTRNKVALIAAALLATVFVQPMALSQAASSVSATNPHIVRSYSTSDVISTSASTPSQGIGAVTYYQGGSVISNPNVYVIWYGSWNPQSCNAHGNDSSTPSIMNDFLPNLGGSDWNKINSTYYQMVNGHKSYVNPSMNIAGCIVLSGSKDVTLDTSNGNNVSDVVAAALRSPSGLPTDSNGVYVVLTSSDIHVAGFLTSFCAYHGFYQDGSTTIKYAFIGDPGPTPPSCVVHSHALNGDAQLNSPNENPSADAMVSAMAHEIVEAVSDPEGLSWHDQAGLENADKCAWTFGAASRLANGSFANMTLGNRQYLIQENVAANTNTCVLSLGQSQHKLG